MFRTPLAVAALLAVSSTAFLSCGPAPGARPVGVALRVAGGGATDLQTLAALIERGDGAARYALVEATGAAVLVDVTMRTDRDATLGATHLTELRDDGRVQVTVEAGSVLSAGVALDRAMTELERPEFRRAWAMRAQGADPGGPMAGCTLGACRE